MENLGQKITYLRKKLNLTQSELGDKLGVTSQAVSKWENDLSEPDLQTTKQLCEIFGISLNEFLGLDTPSQETTENATQSTDATLVSSAKIIVGYCNICSKPVAHGEYKTTARGNIIHCNECNDKRNKENAIARKKDFKKAFTKGLIWLGITLLVGIISIIIFATSPQSTTEYIIYSAISTYCISTLICECIWGGSALEVLLFFCRTFRMPGVIFTWDLDGLKFLILAKLALALISIGLSIGLFLVGLVISSLYAGILFPFSLGSSINQLKSGKIKETFVGI